MILFDSRRPAACVMEYCFAVPDVADVYVHNIAVQTTPALEQVERDLKARLQQYYQHVEKSDYLVKEHNEKP